MMYPESYADTALRMWKLVQPDDASLTVSFYQVDKGWYRLSPKPGTFYDFYAKRVGEGEKSNTTAGVASSRAMIVYGLEHAASWLVAFQMCMSAVESREIGV